MGECESVEVKKKRSEIKLRLSGRKRSRLCTSRIGAQAHHSRNRNTDTGRVEGNREHSIINPYYTSSRSPNPTTLLTLPYPNMLVRISTSPPLAAYSPRGSADPGPFAYAVGPLGDCGCCDCWFWSLCVTCKKDRIVSKYSKRKTELIPAAEREAEGRKRSSLEPGGRIG